MPSTSRRAARGFLVGKITLGGLAGLALAGCPTGGGGTGEPGALEADFTAQPTSGAPPLEVHFTDRSSADATSWSWDFGDGSSSTEQNPSHVYMGSGTFTVALTVGAPGDSASIERPSGVRVQPEPVSDNAIEFGMNPSFHRWSFREIVLADGMARASEFSLVQGGNLGANAPLIPLGEDPPRLGEGWPDFGALALGETVGSRLFGSMEGSLPDGRTVPYVLTWEGTGDCSLVGGAVLGERARGARRVEVLVDPTARNGQGNATVEWRCSSSSPADPVRDVHVWLPGMESTKPLFWPPYVERVQALNRGAGPYSWRTLDWTRVNDYGARDIPDAFTFDLAGVVRTTSPSQGTKRGMCPEFQVAFANEVGANLHLQIPHRTDDLSEADYAKYVRDVLTRIRDGSPAVPGINRGLPFEGLDRSLTLTLELSNELWNSGFPQYRWFNEQATANGRRVHEEIARTLEKIWQIADEVFAGSGVRVRRYVGGFIADPGFARRILESLPAGMRVDAVGPACYFKPGRSVVDGWNAGPLPTPAEVIAAARQSIAGLGNRLAEHKSVLETWTNPDGSHPALELYEAGQSFMNNNEPWGPVARAAQEHPDMYAAYVDDFIPMLVDAGVEVVNWYSFMTDQDPTQGVTVGFGIWNDMNEEITLPVREPYVHEGAPKAAAIYKGPPPR